MPVPAVKSFLRRLSQIPVAVDEKINGLLIEVGEGGGDGLAAGGDVVYLGIFGVFSTA